MEGDAVETLYAQLDQLKTHLQSVNEFSFVSLIEDLQRKAVLLAAASNHEKRVTGLITDFAAKVSADNLALVAFVSDQALHRKYHTLFAWDRANCNGFYRLFGADFLEAMVAAVKADPALDKGAKAFLEIGNNRNRLVHGDYASFGMEKTAAEIIALYRDAETFLDRLRQQFTASEATATEATLEEE